MEFSDEWLPLFDTDFSLSFDIDPINYIRHMVFERNEAWDIKVLGSRGGGKSTLALSLCLLINPKLLDLSPSGALDRCWAFSTEDRELKKLKLKRGDVLASDEQGTEISASSYKWQSRENQHLADLRQIDRVDGIIEIGITVDEMRVIKRLRELYRVEIYPETKLTSRENNGIGMGIDCIVREIVENPFSRSHEERFNRKYFNYSQSGRISRMSIPLPPVDFWNEYMRQRREFKDVIDKKAVPELQRKTSKNVKKLKENPNYA